MFFIMNGTKHLLNPLTLIFGTREIVTTNQCVFGPKYTIHGGQCQNYAPHPGFEAACLIGNL